MDPSASREPKVSPFRSGGPAPSVASLPTLLWCVAIVAALYFGREILLPFALAILFSFLLAPLTKRMERRKIPRTAAVLLVVLVAVIGVATLSFIVFGQLYDLADQLPRYQGNITAKLEAFELHSDSVVSKIATAFSHFRSALRTETQQPGEKEHPPADDPEGLKDGAPTADAAAPPPMRVELVTPVSMWGIFGEILGPLLAPLASALIVVVFVIFMLLEREDLRNRFIRLVGPQQLNFTTQALDSAANRISRYLRMQLIINLVFGLIATVGLFLLGVPNPVLWGTVAGLLRFVPFIGPIAGAFCPVLISLLIFDDWLHPLWVLMVFIVDELVANNFLEPKLYGSSTGISPLAVVFSMVFWLWLWGPVGLILAMPLTVCLSVMGSYVPRMGFLTTMLSDEDALSPPARFYQRLLALDVEEALDICEDYQKQNSVEALCDHLLVPALRLAQADRHRGTIEETKYELVVQTVRDVTEDLVARPVNSSDSPAATVSSTEPAAVDSSPATLPASPNDPSPSAICLPAHDAADEVVGMMLVELLRFRGVPAAMLSSTSLASEMVSEVARHCPAVVCVSALPPFSIMHARYLCKRLTAEIASTTTLVAGLWQPDDETAKGYEKLAQTGVRQRFSGVSEAADAIAKLVTSNRLLNCA